MTYCSSTKDVWITPPSETPTLANDVHIWMADLSSVHAADQFVKVLSEQELKRAEQYKFEKDKYSFITSRGILRTIVSKYLSIEPKDINFEYNDFGKPLLSKNLNFNLSHSENIALYAFTKNNQIGIDIEKIRYIENIDEIAREHFSADEIIDFKSIQPQNKVSTFFRCWTRKEAFIKAIGNGLSHPLDEFRVSLLPNQEPKLISIKSNTLSAQEWTLYSLKTLKDFEAAFIFKGHCESISLWKFI